MATPPKWLLSHQEDCMLKTALAFVTLRNRLKQKESDNSANNASRSANTPPPPPRFVRNLLPSSTTTSLPFSDKHHLESMMRVAVSTAMGLYKQQEEVVVYQYQHDSSLPLYTTLNGLTHHLASQLRSAVSVESLQEELWIQSFCQKSFLGFLQSDDDKPIETLLAICTVWHGIHYWDCTVATRVVHAIGKVLQDLYNNTMELDETTMPAIASSNWPNVLAVNMLRLLEAITSMRLQQNVPLLLEELQQALGTTLTLAVPISDMACFTSREWQTSAGGNTLLTAGAKLMMRVCLYDLMQKVAAVQQGNNNGGIILE